MKLIRNIIYLQRQSQYYSGYCNIYSFIHRSLRSIQCSCMHAFWVLSILVSLSGSSVKIGSDVCKEYAQKLIIRGQVLFNAKMIVNKSLSRHLRLLILFNVAGKFVHLMTADGSQMVYSEIRTININIKSCPGPAPSQCWATVVCSSHQVN